MGAGAEMADDGMMAGALPGPNILVVAYAYIQEGEQAMHSRTTKSRAARIACRLTIYSASRWILYFLLLLLSVTRRFVSH